jgi:hypothetical protein
MASMRSELRRGVLLGAPIGYLTGLAFYGGIGFWAAGTAGLWIGCAVATVFAVVGLRLCLRYVDVVTR